MTEDAVSVSGPGPTTFHYSCYSPQQKLKTLNRSACPDDVFCFFWWAYLGLVRIYGRVYIVDVQLGGTENSGESYRPEEEPHTPPSHWADLNDLTLPDPKGRPVWK